MSLDARRTLRLVETPTCECGAPPTANGRECGPCYRERIGSVGTSFSPSRGGTDRTADQRLARRLEHYRKSRMEGIQPTSTRVKDVDAALAISDHTQQPFRADTASRLQEAS